MPRLTPVQSVVISNEVIDGQAIVKLQSPRSLVTIELDAASPWAALLGEDAAVTYTLDVTSPAPVAVPDVVTSTATLESAGAAEPTETPVDAPTIDAMAAPTPTLDPVIYSTPASDVPPPTLTSEQPAVKQDGMANASIADVKEALGI